MIGTSSPQSRLQSCLSTVQSALRAGDLLGAMKLSDKAVSDGLEHQNLLVLAAHYQLTTGSPERACELARRARALAPRDIDVLNVLGQSLLRLGRARDSLQVFDAALRQTPNAAAVRFNKAAALDELRETKLARREYERVLDVEPAHAGALAALAFMASQRGDNLRARQFAEQALRVDPGMVAARLGVARTDVDERKFSAAIPRLQSLIRDPAVSPVNRTIAFGLLGDALEGIGNTKEAFDAYSASQATLRAQFESLFGKSETEQPLVRVDRLTRYFRTASREKWCASRNETAPGGRTHVFLVGFPRSGTTLLEQVLASHPDIESMEERDCLEDAERDFIAPEDGLERLAGLDAEELERYRKAYWKRVADEGFAPKLPVFVDKLPLNSVLLCLIARLFPRSKIILALRDPRDVVLSSFRRRFVMSRQMYELTSLDGAADYYGAVMGLCEVYREKLDLAVFDTRYEDLVTDFEGQAKKLCAFIGAEWNDAMLNFAERARSGAIATPSAPQVARGLFTQGMGQWRAYRNELAPILPKLAPWVARFGYIDD
jgi:tetratricopeptide (TPR) repeat protein